MKTLGLIAMCVVVTSCATVTHGPLQRVHVDSSPPGAAVTKTDCGTKTLTATTPAVMWVSRRATKCTLTFRFPDCETESVVLQRAVSPAVDANFFAVEQFDSISGFFFGLLGGVMYTALDATTGAMYEQQPSRVRAVLCRVAPSDP